MDNLKQRGHEDASANNAWMTVPTFGDWDTKNGALPDYSMDFSKIREMRKQNKSLGDDDDLLAHAQAQKPRRSDQPQANSAQTKLGRPCPADDRWRRPLHACDHSTMGGKFDHVDRLFQSMESAYINSLSNTRWGTYRRCCSPFMGKVRTFNPNRFSIAKNNFWILLCSPAS